LWTLWIALLACWVHSLAAQSPVQITVDCALSTNRIRALHGANFGPWCDNGIVDLTPFHQALGLPSTRLHDIPWTYNEVVDIHTVFRNFHADPSNPSSFDFRRTDDYIAAVTNTGAQILYRLGESIEHTSRRYWVHPPLDSVKWAEICLGVIRHYNQGWADGFRHGIQEWEIWNEPENQPACWTGTDDQYFDLYRETSRRIRSEFPSLRIGGPAVGNSGELRGGKFEPSKFVTRFLQRCRLEQLPLDFFSWHAYTDDPAEIVQRAEGIRRLLNEHGFTGTRSSLNEWNYLPNKDWFPFTKKGQGVPRDRLFEHVGGADGASFVAAVLIGLQDAPVDMANYFSADNQGFGLFSPGGAPRQNYHAFLAFRNLLETPIRLPVSSDDSKAVFVLAGTNLERSQIQILVSNPSRTHRTLKLRFRNFPRSTTVEAETHRLDAQYAWGTPATPTLSLQPVLPGELTSWTVHLTPSSVSLFSVSPRP